MTAAAQRASLAAIGRDLAPVDDDRRASALLRAVSGRPGEVPEDLGDLAAAPDWLCAPRETQRELARSVALLAMAPCLATSIDGAWLGSLAKLCGEDLLDWAIAHAESADGITMPQAAPDQVEAAGFGLLRTALRPGLYSLLDWAPGGAAMMSPDAAERLVAIAWARERS